MSDIARQAYFEQMEAERWAHRLADGWAMCVGGALAERDKSSEAVFAMVEASAGAEDIMADLVMAGLARRVERRRWGLRFRTNHRVVYELTDRSAGEPSEVG